MSFQAFKVRQLRYETPLKNLTLQCNTQCTNMLCMILKMNTHYFPKIINIFVFITLMVSVVCDVGAEFHFEEIRPKSLQLLY
jgi:hypothetical protein